jgi:hypothetical protein
MERLCFYISSHGFGHATREIEVISHIPERVEVEIITAVPEWLFRKSLSRSFTYTLLNHDCGIIQPNSFMQDVEATHDRWHRLLHAYPSMAEVEAKRLQDKNVKAVIGDISPFAVEVGKHLGVPSFIIANFSWDWIFTVLVPTKPAMQDVIDGITSIYQQTDCLLRTPLSGDMPAFPFVEDVPLIVRTSRKTKSEAREAFGIAQDANVVLISFGGMGCDQLNLNQFYEYEDILFLTFDRKFGGAPNVELLDPQETYHPDAIQACDVALAKLGYGMVTECIAHQTPIAFPPRQDFPEHEVLEREIARYVPTFALSTDAFFSGRWAFLRHLFGSMGRHESLGLFEEVPALDGGEKVVERIMQEHPVKVPTG